MLEARTRDWCFAKPFCQSVMLSMVPTLRAWCCSGKLLRHWTVMVFKQLAYMTIDRIVEKRISKWSSNSNDILLCQRRLMSTQLQQELAKCVSNSYTTWASIGIRGLTLPLFTYYEYT